MSAPATCPVCGQFVTAKGETVYRGGLIPPHQNQKGTRCLVRCGTVAKDGPDLVSKIWTPPLKAEALTDWWQRHCDRAPVLEEDLKGKLFICLPNSVTVGVPDKYSACSLAFSIVRDWHLWGQQ